MPRGNYPSDKADQYIVRMPDGMRPFIKAQAAQNQRSMNAEIIYRLNQAYGLNAAAGEQIGVKTPAAKHKTDVEASAC